MAVPSGTRTVKQQIADQLRNEIFDGTRPPGGKLPTEAELMESFGVARNTARDALGLLVNEGLIESRRPHGYFIRDRKRMTYRPQDDLQPPSPDAQKDVFITEQSRAGRDPHQTIDVAIVAPPVVVRDRLKLEADELAVVRRRVRYLEGEPFYINDSYYPLEIVKDTPIMAPLDIPEGANQALANRGFVQVRAVDEIFFRMPSPDEVTRLDLTAGTPIALHIITGYGPDDLPIRCVYNVLPGDRHVITFDRPGLPLPSEDQ
ncbi:hypothetical protein Kisp02_01870 [Kineosporia sp. NBRC 101731]|nr:hypothetical protein Kisp02_01870 [Kineosporia sp. NBRC 101731]